MGAYYNEIDAYAAQWLRNLIGKGLIAKGDVDERSICDVAPEDLHGYTQAHFFAGIGGWSHALRLAGWPDDRPVWTGSCPCQPFSVAGKGLGADDPRHLWPHFHRLIAACKPPVVFGEQVSGAAGYGWLDGVRSDLAGEDYACEAFDIPACAVDAPHIRSRLYWVASDMEHSKGNGGYGAIRRHEREKVRETIWSGADGDMADAGLFGSARDEQFAAGGFQFGKINTADSGSIRCNGRADQQRHEPNQRRWEQTSNYVSNGSGSFWSDHIWLTGADGKARRAKPGLPLLAVGIPARVGRLRAYGNAIVPQLAAEVIGAFLDARP